MPVPGDFDQNIPQPTDQLSVSQGQLLDNFGAIYALIGVNHLNFDTGAPAGKHLYLQFPSLQGADVATGGNEMAVYTKTGFNTTPAMYIRQQNNAAVSAVGFTEAQNGTPGWTMLPSGLLMKWGQVNLPGNGQQTLNFNVGATIPVFKAAQVPPMLSILPVRLNAGVTGQITIYVDGTGPQTNTQFTIYVSGTVAPGTISIAYYAIGLPNV